MRPYWLLWGEIMIIERTTEDCLNETINLFLLIKPLLDQGESYSSAVKQVHKTPSSNLAWYKDLIKYGESQGYPYQDYMRKRKPHEHTYTKLKVVEQSTVERYQETVQLFEEIKPLLDKEVPFYRAVMQIKGINHLGFLRQRWYKDLRNYAESKGYYTRWNRPEKIVNGGYKV
jgi:hypothetical protein